MILGNVGVVGCLSDSVVADIGQSFSVKAAVTSHVAVKVTAIDQLLLGEIHFLALEESKGLKNGDCAERPAGSALPLIFHRRNHATLSPIHLSIHSSLLSLLLLNNNPLVALLLTRDVHEIGGSELIISEG